MPLTKVTVGDIIQVRVVCRLLPQFSINILHGQCSAITGVGVNAQEIADQLDVDFGATVWLNAITSRAQYWGTGVKILGLLVPEEEAVAVAQRGAGAMSASVLPLQDAGLVQGHTGLATRMGRGRTYMPFPAVEAITAIGNLAAGYLATLQLLCDIYHTTLTVTGAAGTADFNWGVLHKDKTTPLGTISRYIRALCALQMATQRRRGYFGKPNVDPFGT